MAQMGLYVLMIVLAVAGIIVSSTLRRKFAQYSKIPLPNGLTGRDIAERMLHENGIADVQVISVAGELTDHYDPAKKTVNLSEGVYNASSIAAAAVAAHECGHAVQHRVAYPWLGLRSQLVPVVGIASRFVMWVILGGLIVLVTTNNGVVLLAGIALFGVITLFSFITLPVEIDASRRALAWLSNSSLAGHMEMSQARDALKWAALTYVIAALGSLATLLYYISIYTGRR